MREEMESVHNQTKFVIWLITKITEKCKTIEEVRSVIGKYIHKYEERQKNLLKYENKSK